MATDSTAEPDVDPEEARIRAVLASIPLERLRRAGLLDTLTELASGKDQAEKDAGEKEQGFHRRDGRRRPDRHDAREISTC
ncbi:hypothetical protein SANTM175S_03764 [Streptomyces antimycoticus]